MLSKEDKRDVAEIVGQVVAGVLAGQRTQSIVDASDPASPLSQMRKGGAPHRTGEISGLLTLHDAGTAPGYAPTGAVIGAVQAVFAVDYSKKSAGYIYEARFGFELPIGRYDTEFRETNAQRYRDSEGELEHLAALEKERLRFIGANLWHRCRAWVLNQVIGRTVDDAEVRAIFTPDAPAVASAAE